MRRRLAQLTHLASAAADVFLDVVEPIGLTHEEADPQYTVRDPATLKTASRQLTAARAFTALAPEECANSAETLAAELLHQTKSFSPTAATPVVSPDPARHAALRQIARGHVEIVGIPGTPYARIRDGSVPLALVRALEADRLVVQHGRPGYPDRRRLHLTPAGRRIFTTASRPRSPASPGQHPPKPSPGTHREGPHR